MTARVRWQSVVGILLLGVAAFVLLRSGRNENIESLRDKLSADLDFSLPDDAHLIHSYGTRGRDPISYYEIGFRRSTSAAFVSALTAAAEKKVKLLPSKDVEAALIRKPAWWPSDALGGTNSNAVRYPENQYYAWGVQRDVVYIVYFKT